MIPENTTKLLAAYPRLYRTLRDKTFECEDGWFDLVWQVSAEIEATAALEGIIKTSSAWPSVGILKQKLGTLRVQFDSRGNTTVSDAIKAIATKAYEQSIVICELCGAPAHCDSDRKLARWVETLCDKCRNEHRPPPKVPDEN
jgi:hypothetical protein